MKILFRADGNNKTGWGHVMRSLSIASTAREMGIECGFITADDYMVSKINSYGFDIHMLNSDYCQMDDEISYLEAVLKKLRPDILFVDSYYVTNSYFSKIRRITKVAYLDDVYAFPYNVDFLINYNIYASLEEYEKLYKDSDLPELILGLRYVPLRNEFRNVKRIYKDKVDNIFISTGGLDDNGIVLKIINKLLDDKKLIDEIKYHFVIGSYEPDREEIYEVAKKNKWICLHENVTDMVGLMTLCDLAVSAAGSTLYELCACGVPTITYIIADNQKRGAIDFSRQGIMCNAGDLRCDNFNVANILSCLKNLIFDSKKRNEMSQKMISIIDGNGANRIINKLLS